MIAFTQTKNHIQTETKESPEQEVLSNPDNFLN